MFYNAVEHPTFVENESLRFSVRPDFDAPVYEGRVKGIATIGEVDNWIIECHTLKDEGISMFSTISLPHTLIYKEKDVVLCGYF